MKRIMLLAALVMVSVMLTGCFQRVPAGNVGVKFNKFGGDKGVDIQDVGPGYYWLGWNWDLYLFPTFTQNYTWEKASKSGDESFSFQTVEGLAVDADIGITYHIDPAKVTTVFQKYRRGVDEITDTFLRNMVRDSLNRNASDMGIESVYGKGKSDLIDHVEKEVRAECAPIGIIVDHIYWIGNLRLPQNVVTSINAKIQATQMAQQRENEVAQATAEAQKEVAKAKGEAAATLAKAEAEAKSIQIKGDALRSNPEVIELEKVNRWNGVLPQYMLGQGNGTLITLPTNGK